MAKRRKSDSVSDEILKAIAIFGGAWLGVEILKSMAKKEVVYDCPVCKYAVKFGTPVCPNCESKLSWPPQTHTHG